MAAPFGPHFALPATLFAALRGGLAGGVGFRQEVADGGAMHQDLHISC